MNSLLQSSALLAIAAALITGCDQRPTTTAPANTPSNTPSTNTSSSQRNDAYDTTAAADNTARNRGDTSAGLKTPMDQSESAAAIKTTADIRRAIMNDAVLSTTAKNCKIITDKDGLVTLRGPVNSQAEKDSIAAKAKAIAGETRVDNQLEVKTN